MYMKTIVVTACLFIFITFSTTPSQTYLISLSNASQPNFNTFEFDVYIKSSGTDFLLTSYQCAFTFNSVNANGNPSFSFIANSSELSNIPVYAVGINNNDGIPELTFASSAGKDTIKSAAKRIGKFRINNSSGFTNPFNVNWNFDGSVNTILTGITFKNITNPAYHTNLSFTAKKENPPLSLTVYPLNPNDNGYLTPTGVYINTEISYMGKISSEYRTSLLRFPNAGTAAGKIIDSAFVFFTAYGNSKYPGANIRITANDTANARTISSNLSAELGKVLTTAKVDWNDIPGWQSGYIYQSPDLKTIIQEWANLPNHKDSSDALLLFFSDNLSSKNGRRVFGQWEYSLAKGPSPKSQEKPKLVIYYHTDLPKHHENNQIENLTENYKLCQNYPNPFNPTTTIQYQIPQDGLVTLKVYDILGSEIITLVNEQKGSGTYNVNFDAYNLPSGTYIYAIKVNDFISTQKMILLK
jgi:hypothetical protein